MFCRHIFLLDIEGIKMKACGTELDGSNANANAQHRLAISLYQVACPPNFFLIRYLGKR